MHRLGLGSSLDRERTSTGVSLFEPNCLTRTFSKGSTVSNAFFLTHMDGIAIIGEAVTRGRIPSVQSHSAILVCDPPTGRRSCHQCRVHANNVSRPALLQHIPETQTLSQTSRVHRRYFWLSPSNTSSRNVY